MAGPRILATIRIPSGTILLDSHVVAYTINIGGVKWEPSIGKR
jgi:hypothetical protein